MTGAPTLLDRHQSDRLAAAKLWLISSEPGTGCANLPYLSVALFALVPVATDRVVAMGVDQYWRLYVNPGWLEAHDIPDIAKEVAHHVWHLLADHASRAADMNVTTHTAPAWRTAADATVCEILPWLADDLRSPEQLGLPKGRSAEEYFAILTRLAVDPQESLRHPADDAASPTNPDASCGSACDGIARPHELPPTALDSPAISRQGADAIRQQVAIEFRNHQSSRGTAPGEWSRWVQQILEPVVPWQQVLHAAVRRGIGWTSGHTDYTYTRISRRQAASGNVVLPALRRPTPAVAIVVDTSGSIDDGLLAQALGEIDGVLATLAVPDSSITVLAVDAAVHTVDTVRSARAVRLGGGGGTDMEVGIQAALATRPSPQLVIVITDGYTPWPGIPPPTPVVAALVGRSRDRLPPTPGWLQRVEVVPDS